ncbi:HlyD family efflux transporter periplasmic adaptor subunit [Desulfococcaceae bacterium HSG9]|nr:HlyD family efflux transporter periplasmic adaptor subunit [Desulfococcaceae bacterium HSG9]
MQKLTAISKNIASPEKWEKIDTGQLRRDIQVLSGSADDQGEPTWMLFDPVADKYYKMGLTDYAIISRLFQNQTVAALVDQLTGSGVPTDATGIMTRLNFLNHSNLMVPVYAKTEQRLTSAREARARSIVTRLMSSYLFFKVPLWKPDNFLSKTYALVALCINPWTLLILSLIALTGYVHLIVHWSKFIDAMMRSFTFHGLFKYSIIIIFLKIGHEFAHAYAAKWAGVRVRRFGIGFMVFFPRLYTDITDAWRVQRRKRVLIDAAGILMEILTGGLAVLVWLNTAPGVANTLCYYIFAVSVLNTVFINGNPFIRYDGYYLLMDATGIDNLQRRGFDAVKTFLRTWLLGIPADSPVRIKGWKAVFLIWYGLAAMVYRIFLYTAIILIVYYQFTKAVGLFLAGLEVYLFILRPLIAEARVIGRQKNMIRKANLIVLITVVSILLALCIAPLPWPVSMPCEVKAQDSQILYVRQDGFLAQLHAGDGSLVKRNQPLFTQSNPLFELEGERWLLEIKQLQAELDQVQSSARTIALKKAAAQRLQAAIDSYKEHQRQRALFETRAAFAGVLTLYDPLLEVGKWLSRGDEIGEVSTPAQFFIYAYIKEKKITDIHPKAEVTITLQNELYKIAGKVASVNLAPIRTLTATPLLDIYGGPLTTLPDKQHSFKLAEPYYRITITPQANADLPVGRTGTAKIYVHSSLFGGYLRTILRVFQKEMSF